MTPSSFGLKFALTAQVPIHFETLEKHYAAEKELESNPKISVQTAQ